VWAAATAFTASEMVTKVPSFRKTTGCVFDGGAVESTIAMAALDAPLDGSTHWVNAYKSSELIGELVIFTLPPLCVVVTPSPAKNAME